MISIIDLIYNAGVAVARLALTILLSIFIIIRNVFRIMSPYINLAVKVIIIVLIVIVGLFYLIKYL